MAVLSDISDAVRKEQLLRQNEAWLNAILSGITDYAVVSLDQHGCMDEMKAGGVSTTDGARRPTAPGFGATR
jgi:hypothetical protein